MNHCMTVLPPAPNPDPDPIARPSPRGFFSAAVLLLAAASAVASPLVSEEQELANRLVTDRGQHRDSRRMVLDPVLTSVARARAADMARRHYFSHTDPDGNGPNVHAQAAGYELPSSWGRSRAGNFIETIGAGYATPAAAWDAWMQSSSHRTHLLAQSSFYRDQTKFGVGFCSDPSSPFRRYWVILTAPPSRNVAAMSQRGTKGVRIAVAVPAWTEYAEATAPRPSATRPAAAEKLWTCDESEYPLKPRAPRPGGAS